MSILPWRVPGRGAARPRASIYRALAGFGIALLPACALPFWDLPAASTGGTIQCTQPGAPRCGSSTQQCEDGNPFDLDGCDSSCGYEVVLRMSDLSLSDGKGPAVCLHPQNQLGSAFGPALASVINPALKTSITSGDLNIMVRVHCLADLSGTNASNFTIGVLDGEKEHAWSTPSAPEDWSFLARASSFSRGVEKYLITNGSIVNHQLLAGPSDIVIPFSVFGTTGSLELANTTFYSTVSATTSHPGPPPAKLPPGLLVFDSLTANDPGQGLCGDVPVRALANTPLPDFVKGYCGQMMTCGGGPVSPTCNSFLDLLIVGCPNEVNPTQPDVPGSTPQITPLTADPVSHKVTLPPDDTDAYSAFFNFAALRQHVAGVKCANQADCQSGQTCESGVCYPR